MTRIKTGKAGLNYILNEAAHDNSGQRNQFLTGVNLVDGVSWYKQYQYYWDRASDEHETQLRHLICSFSDREVNPNNPDEVANAHQLFTEYVQEFYPNRQIIVATQIDGESGLAHCHAMVNDCDMIDTRGCSEQQRYYKFFMQTCDDFMQSHGIVLDRGRNHDVATKKSYEQIYEIKCAEVAAERAELAEKLAVAMDAGDTVGAAKLQKELDTVKEPYVWKEHLRQRIQEAKEAATTYDEFIDSLDARGVISDDSGKHNKFRLKEEEYAKFTDKAYPEKAICRGKTLNADFSREALQAYFESLEVQDEDEAQIEPESVEIKASEALKMAETTVADEVTETKVEAVVEPVDERKKVSSEIADVEPAAEVPVEPKVRRVGRRSTKRNYMREIIESENEGEEEDEALAAAGYAENADLEEISEDEADSMERMRATILELMRKGEAFDEDDFGDDEDDRSL